MQRKKKRQLPPEGFDLTNDTKQPNDDAAVKTGLGHKDQTKTAAKQKPVEIGGRKGPEPTRYGDWEKNGIISDF